MSKTNRSQRLGPLTLRWGAVALTLASLLFCVPAYAAADDAPASGKRRVLDRVAALVGQEVITEGEIDRAVAPFLPQIFRISDPTARMEALDDRRFKVLEQLVNDALVLDEAERLDLPVTDEEVEAHILKTQKQNGWTREQLIANLKQVGYPTLAAYREKTRKELLKAYAFQIRVGSRVNVTQEEIDREFRERHPGDMQDEVRARHILIRIPEITTVSDLDRLRAEAEGIRQQIVSGAVTFEQAAKLYSQDGGTKEDGGDLGYFTRYLLDEEFTAMAFALHKGEMSPVVQTPLGLHIIRVDDRRQIPIDDFSRDEVRAYITDELTTVARERAYRQWIRELKEAAYLDIRLEHLTNPGTDAHGDTPGAK